MPCSQRYFSSHSFKHCTRCPKEPSSLPNGEKCPQKEPFPQLKKIRGTIREKSLFPAPDWWQTHKATQLQGLEENPCSPLTFPMQAPASLFLCPSPRFPYRNGLKWSPYGWSSNFRAFLQLLMSSQQKEPSLGVKEKGLMEDHAEGTPQGYLRAAGDRTNISPHCHNSY